MRNIIGNENGAALIVTLLVIVIMTVTLTEFMYSTWVDRSLAAGFRDDVRAVAAVRAGVDAARAVIIEDKKEDIRNERIVDHLGEFWSQQSLPVPIGNTYAFVTITDESSKIDLNRLTEGSRGEKLRPVFRRLLNILEMDDSIADAVIDWIDDDEDGFFENGYYMSLPAPYQCKNKKLDSLDEIKRIKGITPKVFNRLKNFVTIRSTGWININSAPVELIQALHEDISRSMAESVIEARRSAYFRSPVEIKNVSGFNSNDLYANIGSIIGVYGDSYAVSVVATFNDVTRTANALFTDRSDAGARLIYFRIS
ncbi:MAG: type II secretion system minor pseudopilin GspK [Nitrospinota bacterium]